MEVGEFPGVWLPLSRRLGKKPGVGVDGGRLRSIAAFCDSRPRSMAIVVFNDGGISVLMSDRMGNVRMVSMDGVERRAIGVALAEQRTLVETSATGVGRDRLGYLPSGWGLCAVLVVGNLYFINVIQSNRPITWFIH